MGVASCKSVIGRVGGVALKQTDTEAEQRLSVRSGFGSSHKTRPCSRFLWPQLPCRPPSSTPPTRIPHLSYIYNKCSLDGELNWVTRAFTGEPAGDDPQGAIRQERSSRRSSTLRRKRLASRLSGTQSMCVVSRAKRGVTAFSAVIIKSKSKTETLCSRL